LDISLKLSKRHTKPMKKRDAATKKLSEGLYGYINDEMNEPKAPKSIDIISNIPMTLPLMVLVAINESRLNIAAPYIACPINSIDILIRKYPLGNRNIETEDMALPIRRQ